MKKNIVCGKQKENNMYERLYEDDNWVIEKSYHHNDSSRIRISYFKNYHFVDDLELTEEMFKDEDLIDRIKELINEFKYV